DAGAVHRAVRGGAVAGGADPGGGGWGRAGAGGGRGGCGGGLGRPHPPPVWGCGGVGGQLSGAPPAPVRGSRPGRGGPRPWWARLVPPLPALMVSLWLDGPTVATPDLVGIGAVLYLGLGATVLAHALWGRLLRAYPAATVAPLALLVPVVAAASSAALLGERF